jgi:hypothetical protein
MDASGEGKRKVLNSIELAYIMNVFIARYKHKWVPNYLCKLKSFKP